MNCMTAVRQRFVLLAVLGVAGPAAAQETAEPGPQEVWFGDEIAVTYEARIEGDWLVVEARHEPGWHTYAMDNLERAREATGRERPDAELPTLLTPSSEIELASDWRQTAPTDLSQPDIRWYTWGFEDRSFFAARVERAEAGAWVQVDAQACTDRLCAIVDALPVLVTRSRERSVDPDSLALVGDLGWQAAEVAARELLAVFGDWLQRSMDIECSGQVPMGRLLNEVLLASHDWPRHLNWAMALDVDANGFIEPGEFAVAMWERLEKWVEGRMSGDVDGDEALTPREYALAIPDPGAERNEEQLSTRQEENFAAFDGNGDRRVTRDEVMDRLLGRDVAYYWGRMVAFHLRRADSDGDGAVIREEVTEAIAAAGGSVAPGALDVWFEATAVEAAAASAPRLVLADLPFTFRPVAAVAENRAKLEAPLAPLLMPACSAPSSASP